MRTCFFTAVLALALGAASPAHAVLDRLVPSSREEVVLSYAPLVQQATPAVVNIYTRKVVTQRVRSPMFDDPFWRRFLGDRPGFGERQRRRVQNSLGSGVILSADGVVVTNHHVIEGADEITVALADRREFTATVLLSDEPTDLAYLKIDTGGEALPFVELAASDDLLVGDIVMAIGNPFGVGQTVTVGIVSALARTQVSESELGYFIQTDAAINPGNSGGALLGMHGRLVGVNTAIFSRSGGSHGIGFAIPADLVGAMLRAALDDGQLRRPWFGASGQVVTSDIAEGLGLDRPIGILINDIYPDGPADDAGVREGDVIVAIDGGEVFDVPSLNFRLATREMGSDITVELLRRGEARTVALTAEPAPEEPPRNLTQLAGEHPFNGVTVGNLSPAYAEELGLSTTETGVIVVDVPRGAYARRFNLAPGEIVERVNDRPIDRVADLEAATASGAEVWQLVMRRGGQRRSIAIR